MFLPFGRTTSTSSPECVSRDARINITTYNITIVQNDSDKLYQCLQNRIVIVLWRDTLKSGLNSLTFYYSFQYRIASSFKITLKLLLYFSHCLRLYYNWHEYFSEMSVVIKSAIKSDWSFRRFRSIHKMISLFLADLLIII